MSDLVHLDVDRAIATITLDSPHNRNALSAQLVEELDAHLRWVSREDDIRAVVLTGTGTVFCSGADLKEAGTSPPVSFSQILTAISMMAKPTVARVNGRARAGGIGLLAACDIAIAPESADFAFTEVRIGVSPAMIAVVCLRTMSTRAAHRYLLTGERFDAGVAAEIGLVSEAVPDDELDRTVNAVLEALRGAEPHALEVTKELIEVLPTMTLTDGLLHASGISEALFRSDAAAEGMAAFREKRTPAWAPTGS